MSKIPDTNPHKNKSESRRVERAGAWLSAAKSDRRLIFQPKSVDAASSKSVGHA